MDMAISPMVNNKQRYREVATDLPNLPVFFNPWYLDAACGDQNWEVCISQDNGGRIQGVLPYFRSSKYGISHITMPLLLPYLGPWVIHPQNPSKQATRYSYEKKVLTTLLQQIPKVALIKMHCHPKFSNVLAAYWHGYEMHVRYTYIISQGDKDKIWDAIDAKQRNIITSVKDKFKVIESENINEFYRLNSLSFSRSGNTIPYNAEYINRLYNALKLNDKGRVYMCIDRDNQPHAAILLANDKQSTYCLGIGNDPKHKNSGALSFLMWRTILDSLKETESFNFEGGMIPNIEKFFRSFGGQLTPYYKIQKAKTPFLKGLFTWINKM